MPSSTASLLNPLVYDRQVAYFAYCLRQLPTAYAKLDTNRLTLLHFAVQALDLLQLPPSSSSSNEEADRNFWNNETEQRKLRIEKNDIIDWIYALQITTEQVQEAVELDPSLSAAPIEALVGFKGGTFLGGSFLSIKSGTESSSQQRQQQSPPWHYNHGHIAMTYTALCTLRTLGDDWSRVDRAGIIQALPYLQLDDGSFKCIAVGSEHDMRFVYCATAISYMLNDWSGVDIDRTCQYIRSCKSFDGALALIPGQEGHGGSTFTGIAALVLMNRFQDVVDAEWRRELMHWCLTRQVGGMQGRPNKDEDTCYSYWIGGTLRLLQNQADALLNHRELCDFVFECQTPMGGFGKLIHAPPDVLHSFYSLAYLSMAEEFEETTENRDENNIDDNNRILKQLNFTLGIGAEHTSIFDPQVP